MDIDKKIRKSFKWSTITEVVVKLLAPIINAVLSRLLLPDDFAPLATIMMIISFGEIFVESGFKKYLIQHDFKDEEEYNKTFSVALWTNLGISMAIWGIIAAISKPLATFLGNPEIWLAIIISGVILPMYCISGIYSAKLQKDLKFKKLFTVRTVTASIPLFVTIPLAIAGLNYWSLIVGNIASVFAQMTVLIIVAKEKIPFTFSKTILKQIYSYGVWTILDGIAIWLTVWVDSFIIARYMTEYYLGMYKNSISTVNNLFSIVTASILPVLFVGLSKYQDDDKSFSGFFNSTQRSLALILLPMGVGLFLYSDLAVSILFGENWAEASKIVGIVSITTAIRTIFVSIYSDAYRAKGKVKIPFVLQIIDVCILIPACIIAAEKGFWSLVYVRAFIKLGLIIPEIILSKKLLNIDIYDQLKKMVPIFLCTTFMMLVCIGLQHINSGFLWEVLSIIIAMVVYGASLLIFPGTRTTVKGILSKTS